jgi:hypothetical protein
VDYIFYRDSLPDNIVFCAQGAVFCALHLRFGQKMMQMNQYGSNFRIIFFTYPKGVHSQSVSYIRNVVTCSTSVFVRAAALYVALQFVAK